jgi:hypothetical protein
VSDRARLSASLAYAHAGRRVVPVGRDKKPYFKGWLDKATLDAAQIEAWWREHPDANVVTPTGAEAGFFVLDVDPRNGGDRSLADLERVHGALPPTLTCATGGGGLHYYFKTPSFIVNSSVLALGLDILGERRAVTLPPSIHRSGLVYRWHGPVREMSDAAPWLLELLRPAAPVPQAAPPRDVGCRSTYARAALNYEDDAVRRAAEGTRNNTLNAAGFSMGQLVGAGLLDNEDVVAVLLDAALACGLNECEARATIRSGLRAGIARPRVVRPRSVS